MLSNIMIKYKGTSVKKRSKDHFTLIIGASRPLTMTELLRAHAFALPLGQQLSGYRANLLEPESVFEACGDFISVEDGVVQLVHTSMREFFLRPSHLWENVDENNTEFFRLELQDCHRMLGLSCLDYMRCIDWQTQTHSNQMDDSINDNKLFNYASHYLFSHLLGSNFSLEVKPLPVFEFLISGNARIWVDMILNGEDESSRHLPIKFWDDACHFLGAWGYSDTEIKKALFRHVENDESIFDRPAQYQDSKRRSGSLGDRLVSYCDDNGSGDYDSDAGRETTQKGKKEGKRRVGAYSLATTTHHLTNHAQDNLAHIMKSLPLGASIVPMVQMKELSINPIDAVMAALGKSISKMSFLALMNIGIYTDKYLGRTQQASETFQIAFERVKTEKDIRTAWARLWLGHTSFKKEEYQDAEIHFREAMEILHASHMNPLREYMWYIATGCLIDSILKYGERNDVADLPTQFSQMVRGRTAVSGSSPRYHAGLREECYKIIKESPIFRRKKIAVVLSVAEVYENKALYEDLDELLGPFVNGKTSTINRRSFSEILELWVNAQVALGKASAAVNTISCTKKRMKRPFVSEVLLDVVRFQLARLFYNTGSFKRARNELSEMNLSEWFRTCTHDEIEITLDCLLGIYARLDQAKKVSQILNEIVLTQGYTQNIGRFSTVLSVLLAHRLFLNSEELILKTMSRIPANPQLDDVEKLNLYEALAFSARLQNGHKAISASYNYYKKCVEFAEEKLPNSDLTRILIGMGAACVAASKPEEASAIFRKLVDNYYLRASYAYHNFFLALAYQQDRDSNEYRRLLSKVISTLCSDDDTEVDEEALQASDDGLDEEDRILLITAYMCLADASDTCAGAKGAIHYRERALEVLENKFASSLDPQICLWKEDVSRWTSRWARSCRGYLCGSFDEGERSGNLPEMFPFEVWWAPDAGNDYFKYYSCSV
ncbi:hypothetical protein GGI43DRAFT_81721 [Trichoderma evansii]